MKKTVGNQFWALIAGSLLLASVGYADDRLYWGNEGGGTIQVGNLDGSGAPGSLFSSEGGPCGVTIDSAAGKIYWANFFTNDIRVANIDGTGTATTLFTEPGSLCGVAVDHAAGKIYWADFDSDTIRSGNLDGTGAATVFTETVGSAPSGVTIDTSVVPAKLYWTNQFSDEVRTGNADGSGVASTVYSGEDNPLGVAIDVATQTLYWTNFAGGTVRTGLADGSVAATTIYGGESSPGGISVDSDTNLMYWASFGGSIRTGDTAAANAAATLFGGQTSPLFTAIQKAPQAVGTPVISGTPNIGQVLSCDEGDWASDEIGLFSFKEPTTFQYIWQRNGVDVVGATSSTLVPTRTGRYTCTVTGFNEAGSSSQTSERVNVRCEQGELNCN